MKTYSVIQQDLKPPDLEALQRLFLHLPGVTDEEAAGFAAQRYGLLAQGLSHDQASHLHEAAAAQHIPTRMVPDNLLPLLPPPTPLNRVELSAFALGIFDPLGRPTPVAWKSITLIAAGRIHTPKPAPILVRPSSKLTDTLMWIKDSIVPSREAKPVEPPPPRETLEIFVDGNRLRFVICPREFLFGYVFKHPELTATGKLARLVELLAGHAPNAALNRGATDLKAKRHFEFTYDSRDAFDAESVFLLHRQSEAAPAESAEPAAKAGAQAA